MFHRNSISILFCFLAIGSFCVVGCGPTESTVAPVENTDHDHDDDDHDHDGHDHDEHGHDEHDHDDHADHDHNFDNLGEAVAEIDELSTEISAAFTSGEPESAHDALHHIAEVLEATETVISKSSMDADAKAGALKAVEDLFDSFTAVDETMHGDGGKDFDEVESTIKSSLATLKTVAKE